MVCLIGLFKVKAYAEDAMSAEKRNEFQKQIEGEIIAKPLFNQIEEEFGINVFKPTLMSCLNQMKKWNCICNMKYKPAIEIAEEEAIDTLFSENHYNDIRRRVDYDLTTLGIGITKHEFLPGEGVKINYVDPANVSL